MIKVNVPGTKGYAENAPALIAQWQGISFAEHHVLVADLLPGIPSRVLDVGSGVGTTAAALAAMGHIVVAVEPVDELRIASVELHPSSRVEWLDDSLPDLSVVLARQETFDVVMLTAVWMHLDEAERRQAMRTISLILSHGGLLIMSLRHGPVPEGRRIFDVSAKETIDLGSDRGLRIVLERRTESVQQTNRNMGVTWTWLAFRKL